MLPLVLFQSIEMAPFEIFQSVAEVVSMVMADGTAAPARAIVWVGVEALSVSTIEAA